MNKSPAFQLYPSDFLSDENVILTALKKDELVNIKITNHIQPFRGKKIKQKRFEMQNFRICSRVCVCLRINTEVFVSESQFLAKLIH